MQWFGIKYGIILIALLAGCGARKRIHGQEQVPGVTCQVQTIQWLPVMKNIGMPIHEQVYLPKRFSPYTIPSAQLVSFFQQIKSLDTPIITLPVQGVCKQYRLLPANTMSPELHAQYPQIVSYRGIGITSPSEYASIDFDGSLLRCRIETADGAIIIDPFEMRDGTYYLQYHIKDTGVPKVPFE